MLAPASSLLPFTLPVHLLLRVKPYLPIQPSPRRVLRMFFGDFEVHPAFAAQFGLGVRYFRYANPRRSVFPLPYTDAELQAVTVPTLLLIGDQERIYGPQPALERARRLVPDIRTELVAAAGHILAMQQPDVVNRLLLEFLA